MIFVMSSLSTSLRTSFVETSLVIPLFKIRDSSTSLGMTEGQSI
jgi:hypothetical protein